MNALVSIILVDSSASILIPYSYSFFPDKARSKHLCGNAIAHMSKSQAWRWDFFSADFWLNHFTTLVAPRKKHLKIELNDKQLQN